MTQVNAGRTESIELGRLLVHPDNPNRMSKRDFVKLVRNIERGGYYEPIVVRRHPEKEGFYQIINGYHRWKAMGRLGYERADCVVWEVNDEQVELFLMTLNRLCGRDEAGRKIALIKRLNERMRAGQLSRLLPASKKQIEMLASKVSRGGVVGKPGRAFLNAVVFFVSDEQSQVIERAISSSQEIEGVNNTSGNKARRRAAGLVRICRWYVKQNASENNDK